MWASALWGAREATTGVSTRTRASVPSPSWGHGECEARLCVHGGETEAQKRGVPAGRGYQAFEGELRRGGLRPDGSGEPQLSSCEAVGKPVS